MAGSGIIVYHFAPFCQRLGFYGAPVKKLCLPNIFECPNKEGFYVDTPIQLCIHFIAQFLGMGCLRLAVQIEQCHWICPPSCRFLMSCIKLVWIVQFLHVYGKKPYLFCRFFCAVLYGKWTILHPKKTILHPILHPKLPVKAGCLRYGCRKCRFFFKNFFRRGEIQRSGSCKTSDFFGQKYGCFASKVRMFA